MAKQTRLLQRKNKHQRVRKKLKGTPERPRLAVFRSLKYIYAQIIDDYAGKTLIAVSSLKGFSEGSKDTLSIAKEIGKQIGQLAVQKNIKKVVFDRSGYLYHGRVKALADGAREAGLEF